MNNLLIIFLYFTFTISVHAAERAWVDLPEAEFFPAILESKEDDDSLKDLVSHYHHLNKNDECLLKTRIETLKKIADLISSKGDGGSLRRKFLKLILNKHWYLKELELIYLNNLDLKENLELIHFAEARAMSANSNLKPLVLVNKMMFDPKLPGHWGLFWMETIDPCHRQLMPYYVRWKEIEGKKPHFFMWLETENVPFYIPSLKFLSEDEKTKIKVNIKDGKLVDRSGAPLQMNDENMEYIFVIDLHKNLYVC